MVGSRVVVSQLRRWAEDLVDLSRRNRLLYFKHTRTTSLQFAQDGFAVERGLSGRGWEFFLPDPPPDDPDEPFDPGRPGTGELIVKMSPEKFAAEIERGLAGLAKRSLAEFLDAGIWVLYAGLGQLEWIDVDDKRVVSPLLLVPVELNREEGTRRWRLTLSENGESAINPALAVKLESDFGIELPSLDDLADDDLDNVVSATERAVKGTGWTVSATAVITTFTFQKEVIYRDLHQNEGLIVEHDLVQLLAEGPGSDVAIELDFAPEPEEEMDERHPPEELTCVMDADASQRQCVLAARAGRSFVMDGPPGTGKSQTITNMIAQLIADGKTVLFVSEKAAALDVVQRRLAALKLDPFVLALHSSKATRKAVAQELGAALRERPQSTSTLGSDDIATLRTARRKLTNYAIAMNSVRQPLERSLHDVIGRSSQLAHLPETPIPSADASSMTPEQFSLLRGAAEQLGRAWDVVQRGDDFLWRDLEDPSAGAAREASLRHMAQTAQDALGSLEATTANVCDELSLYNDIVPSDVDGLVELLQIVERRVAAPWQLLTLDDFDSTRTTLRALVSAMRARDTCAAELNELRPRWPEISIPVTANLEETRNQLERLKPEFQVSSSWTDDDLAAHEAILIELQERCGHLLDPLEILRGSFGAQTPPTLAQASRLAALAELAGSAVPPEPSWLNPVMKPALDEAGRVLGEMLATFRIRRDSLSETFTDDILDLDLRGLRTRFRELHTGIRKLGGKYRADKKLLASKTVTGKVTDETFARLDEAVEWQDLAERLSDAESRYGPTLGATYYASRQQADFDNIERAIAIASETIELAGGEFPQAALETQIGLGGRPNPNLPASAAEIAQQSDAIAVLLASDRLSKFKESLEQLPLEDFNIWLESVRSGVDNMRSVLRTVAGSAGTIAEATLVGGLIDEHLQSDADAAQYRGVLDNSLDDFVATISDPDDLTGALDWCTEVHSHFGERLDDRTAKALTLTELVSGELDQRNTAVKAAFESLFGEFQPGYAQDLRKEAESSYSQARHLLGDLERTVSDVATWESFVSSRDILAARGWRPVVDSCIKQRVTFDEVPDIIERAILQRWCDQQIDADKALKPNRSVDRDAILAEYRAIDEELVQRSAAAVINMCAERRPKSLVGPAGVINQQSQLRRRHMPVRKLLEEAGDVAQRLKPCFMMSPLSVSQFLPTGLTFDVVIFDEASQVREADAICCIYRGRQLVIAGDQKQLPPTSFFDRMTDDDEDIDDHILDFESVLDRCKAQGFPGLPLNWHYRSQHESLIAFSNRSFYDGRLATFPGAVFEDPSLGVELFRVDGVYHRGGTRDNPIEANKVVDRIVYHRRHHPSMTLGVVTLSVAQQVAIETAIERRSDTEPELEALISDDRLDGFFVKNLENVQGDERDLIILSIGYAPDEMGKLSMNFGPMNRTGGERRLNVAVTRARRRVEIVSSISAGNIRSDNPTIQHLRRYLDFAERGIAALALDLDQEGGDTESPFEDEVVRSVNMLGYDPVPQVGVAGYRVDIGVRHPTEPGTYLLGVECDGATYHSSKVARDRDRLRQQVLEGLGWKIHRIWSTAWFSDRATEEERLKRALEAALQRDDMSVVKRVPALDIDVLVEEHDFDQAPEWTEEYREPVASAPQVGSEFTDARSRREISSQILEVVTTSGPIHEDDVLDTIRVAWGLGRAGRLIREAFHKALASLRTKGDVEIIAGFVSTTGSSIVVRVPAEHAEIVRKVTAVDPRELELAIKLLLADASGASSAELRQAWARLFGWRRIGADIEDAFEQTLRRLKSASIVVGDDRLELAD